MKKQKLFFAMLLFAGCSLFPRTEVAAQHSTPSTEYQNDRLDSLKMTYNVTERKSKMKDKEKLSDLKSERADAKMKAKEARRIERDAKDAARESRSAYRSEKKAQKARIQADKQAKKAARARNISDKN